MKQAIQRDELHGIRKLQELVVLTREKERFLLESINNNINKEKCREELICSNLKLVIKIANAYYYGSNYTTLNKLRGSISYEDLVFAGIEGLVIAIDKFNFDRFKDQKLSTFAVVYIKLHIRKLLYCYQRVVNFAPHIIEAGNKLKNIQDTNPNISEDAIRIKMGLSKSVFNCVKESLVGTLSLNQLMFEDDDSNCLEDCIEDKNQSTAIDNMDQNETHDILKKCLAELDPISQDIIESLILSDNKQTLLEIGKRHNKSGERIRQIKKNALLQLKKKIKAYGMQS